MLRRGQSRLNAVYAVAFVVLGVGTIGQFVLSDRQADDRNAALEARVDDGDARAAQSNAQTRRLIRQLRSEGITPVVKPAEVPALPASATASDAQIAAQVSEYFARYPIAVPAVDLDELRGTVTDYLTRNPPPAGANASPDEIAAAVAAELRRNPPPAGADGVPGQPGPQGLSYVDVALDGCVLVLTRSDGATRRVGPVCGAQGAQGDRGERGEPGQPGQDGQPGQPGVVAVVSGPACNGGDGYLVTSTASYDADSQTITYSCTRSTAGLGGLGSDPAAP